MLNVYLCSQDVKKAILEDMVKLGKESGLKSFEQVSLTLILICQNKCFVRDI